MLAHVPSFGRNPRGSPDFLAYPVPKACMHVLGTRVPRRLGVARSASSPKAAQALGCSLTPGLRISFGRVTCMARAASVPGLWALGFLLLACVCGWVRVAVGRGFCLPLPVLAGVLGGCVWAPFLVLSLFCRLFVVFVVGLWCRPAFGTCVVSCAFPLPPALSGSGVRCGRACWARVSAVPRPSWLGCRAVFFALFFFFRLLGVPVPGLVVSSPVSFLSGWAAGFFFFSACFGAPFSGGPPFLAWCCRFWLGGPPVPVWGSCLRCPLGGGFGPLLCCWRAVWWLWRVFARPSPPPLFFFGGGGGLPSCSSLCLPSAGVCSVAGVWCGWSLATPGGGSCVLLPATPGWVSLPVVVGGPRHSWLGSAGGGGVWCVAVVCWWVCGWCVVWLVSRHSWRRFLCATPRHSWLGFASAGGGQSPPLLAGVRLRRWCVVCGALVGLWLVCGVVGPSPLLAEVPVCYSPPLLAGFRCRWWWAVPATPGWGPLAAVVCGVWCVVCGGGVLVGLWLVCGVVGPSPLLAEVPVCYSPPLLAGFRCRWWWAVPATPGWGPPAAVVCGVWCVAVVCWWGCGWCVVWLVPRHSWRRFLCATPRHSWLGFAAAGGGRFPPLLAGVRLRRRCVVCGGGVLVGLWLVCGVVGPSPLLAEVPVCYSPPLLAGFRCRWWWAVPATPGWGPLAAVVCGVWCVVGVPRHSWRRFLCATPRHSWLGFAAAGGGRSPPLLAGVRWRRWCACFAWPGRTGRPPGRVLVRLTFSFGRFVFLLCLAPSGLGLPLSLSLLLPFLVGWGLWCVGWLLPGTCLCAVVRCVLCALSGFVAPGGRRCLAPVRVPWLWPAACLSGVPRGPAWCAAPRPVRSLSVLRSAFPTPWCLSPPRELAPPALLGGCAGHAEAGREPGSLCLPLAPAEAGALGSLRVVPVRGPAMGLSLAGPSGVRLGLRALRWLACVDPVTDASGFPYRPSFDGGLGRCTGAVSCGRRHLPLRVGGRHARIPCVFACACSSWPGRAGRPPGRVLVRLTFSFGRFVFLLCLAPSGLGLPLSLSLLLPFLVGCFSRPPAAWLAPLLCPPLGRWLLFGGCSPAPPPLCLGFLSLLLVALVFFFFFFFSSSSVRPRCLRLSLVSGPGCPGPRRLRCLFCWPSASWLSVRLSLFRAFPLAVGCSRVVAAPPPPFVSRGFCSCRSVLCAVLCCASPGAVLRRAAARCVARWCAVRVVRAAAGAWCCGALLCVVLFPVVCRGAVLSLSGRVVCFPVVGVVCRGALLSCVVFCGAVLSRGAVLLCSAVVLRCCWGLLCPPVGRCAVLCCAVGGLCCFWPGGGVCVLWCSFPRAVLPCLLRSVRCGALLCWLWCPASLCRVLWRCAVVWCFAVVLCCRFAVLFVFALPSCGLSCGACVVCAVVGDSCCGVSLCVVVSPWAFCGVVVLLWCVVVSCCAVRCPVVSCALCRVLRCRAVLRCCAGWLCCAVVCAAGVCFVLFSFAQNPCRFSVPLKTLFFFFSFENKIKLLHDPTHSRAARPCSLLCLTCYPSLLMFSASFLCVASWSVLVSIAKG